MTGSESVRRTTPGGYDLVVRGGTVVVGDGTVAADVGVRGERIAAVGDGLEGDVTLDASGLYVMPGAIDGHVHVRTDWSDDPALLYADAFRSATTAAAFGGVTTLIDQVHVPSGMALLEGLERRWADAEGQCLIDYAEHINLREPTIERVREIPGVVASGCPSVKLFMAYEGYALPDDIILAAMDELAAAGGLAVVHAENPVATAHRPAPELPRGAPGGARPGIIEGEAAYRAMALAALAGCPVLIVHMSAAEAVREVRHAKARNERAYGEFCINHHVLLGDQLSSSPLREYAFPVRYERDRAAVWRGLADGTIDIVSTDHGPYRRVGEEVPHQTISALELRLALLHHFGVNAGRFDITRLVDLCCARPAQLYGLTRKGRIEPGRDADIVLFDPRRAVTITASQLHSDLDYSTYEGVEVRGYPRVTICRGKVVVADGKLRAQPGWGRFVERAAEPSA